MCHSVCSTEMLYDYRSIFVCLFVKQQHDSFMKPVIRFQFEGSN